MINCSFQTNPHERNPSAFCSRCADFSLKIGDLFFKITDSNAEEYKLNCSRKIILYVITFSPVTEKQTRPYIAFLWRLKNGAIHFRWNIQPGHRLLLVRFQRSNSSQGTYFGGRTFGPIRPTSRTFSYFLKAELLWELGFHHYDCEIIVFCVMRPLNFRYISIFRKNVMPPT